MVLRQFKICLFIIILYLSKSLSQWANGICQTPKAEYGFCINILNCPQLLNLLKSYQDPQIMSYLQSSTCGYDGKYPLVCCSSETSSGNNNGGGSVGGSSWDGNSNTNWDGTSGGGASNNGNNNGAAGSNNGASGSNTGGSGSNTGGSGSNTGGSNTNWNGNVNSFDPGYGKTLAPETPAPIPTNPPPTPATAAGTLPRPPTCGLSAVSNTRVVNGVDAKLGEFPWIVALGYRDRNNPNTPRWLCGSTLVTAKHLLTAGHCVYNRPDLYLARLGELDLSSDNDNANPIDVPLERAKVHEGYSSTSFTNDIAVLTLSQTVGGSNIKPICLPIGETRTFEKYYPWVAGWGSLYFNGPTSPKLQVAMLPVISNAQCKQNYANFKTTVIDDRVLCAGYPNGGMDACQGDSGGPLMFARVDGNNIVFYLIGIVSYGFKCAEAGYPGVYTRVTNYMDWIQNNLN